MRGDWCVVVPRKYIPFGRRLLSSLFRHLTVTGSRMSRASMLLHTSWTPGAALGTAR